MTTKTDGRAPAASVEELIGLLSRTTDHCEIAWIAERLGVAGDRRAIRPLLMSLGDCQGRENADTEASVCGALMRLGVMCRCGNCSFSLRPRPSLPDDVVETIHELAGAIPWPYFGTRRI
jgi:hypothetical protein